MGFSPVRIAALAGLTLFVSQAFPASAEVRAKFCDIDRDKSCVTGFIKNRSSATVISVDITQKGKHGCEKDQEHVDTNLAGMNNQGQSFKAHLSDSCRYEIKFNTTKGCKGHKRGTFSRKNLENRAHELSLDGDCGSLYTATGRVLYHHYDYGQPDVYPSDVKIGVEDDESEADDDS